MTEKTPLPDRAPFDYAPPSGPLSVIHVDEDILVVDKPSGLLTVPGRTADLADCLASRADAAYPGATIVHRLDMDTSGVIILARNRTAHRHIGLQFEKRMTSKRYIACVEGRIDANEGTIDLPLRCDWPNRPLQMVCHEQGRAAVTHWHVLTRADASTRLALTPQTGRSHQLRVHMATLGHPILGDSFYGDPTSAPRLMLHAERLDLRHPTGGAWHSFTAPCAF